jgi:hypothetical protein
VAKTLAVMKQAFEAAGIEYFDYGGIVPPKRGE